MFDKQMIRRSFERVTGAFELHEMGRTSPFALGIVVRAQADSLRAIRADIAEPLAGLADSLEAASKDPRPAPLIRDLASRFEAWRKDTLAVLDAEEKPTAAPVTAKARAAVTEEERRAAREALLAEARSLSPSAGAAAAAAPAAPAGAAPPASPVKAAPAAKNPAGDDPDAMSMDEIQRLLDGAKK